MASIVFSAIGYAVGGPLGYAALGGAIGGALGSALFGSGAPDIVNEGPRLTSLKVQTSTYGNMVPIVYGSVRIGGNIIWSTDIKETKHESSESSGGKGGGPDVTSITYTYSISLAIALCEGVIDSIGRIWANGKVVSLNGTGVAHTVHNGSEAQSPSPIIQALLGSVNVPAFRGTAYVVFEDFQLADYGNAIPNFTFEVFNNVLIPAIYETNFNGFQIAKDYNNGTNIFAVKMTADGIWSTAMVNITTGVVTPLQSNMNIGIGSMTTGYDVSYVGSVTTKSSTSATGIVAIITPAQSTTTVLDEVWVLSFAETPFSNQKNIIIFDGKTGAFKKTYSTPDEGLSTLYGTGITFNKELEVFEVASGGPPPNMTAVFYISPYSSLPTTTVLDQKPFLFDPPTSVTYTYGPTVNYKWVRSSPTFLAADSYATSTASSIDTANGVPNYYIGFVYGSSPNATFFIVNLRTGGVIYTNTIANSSISNTTICWDSLRRRFCIFSPVVPNQILRMTKVNVNAAGVTSVSSVDISVTALGTGSISVGAKSCYYLKNSDTYLVLTAGLSGGDRQLYISPATDTLVKFGSIPGASATGTQFYNVQLKYGVTDDGTLYTLSPRTGVVKFIPLGVASGETLASIVADMNQKVGLTPAEYNVSQLESIIVEGFLVNNVEPVRTSLGVLNRAYFFDVVESSKVLKYVRSGYGDIAYISENDLLASTDELSTKDPIRLIRAQELDLPKEVNITYIDTSLDYQQGTQKSKRMSGNAVSIVSTPVSIVFNPTTAKKIADTNLFLSWVRRNSYELDLSTKYMLQEPTDIFVFDYAGKTINAKLVSKTETSVGLATYKLVEEDLGIYNQLGVFDSGTYVPQKVVKILSITVGLLLDIPLLRDEDNASGLYYAAYGVNTNWDGSTLYKSTSGSLASYTPIVSVFSPAIVSKLTIPLANYRDSNTIDELSTFDIVIVKGELVSVTEEQLLNSYNYALVGSELIQFKRAELIALHTYRISGLLRGRRGTEQYINTHVAGEQFIRATTATWARGALDLAETGIARKYATVTFGQDVATASSQFLTLANNGLKPYSPVLIGGGLVGTDLVFQWKRRGRISAGWLDSIDVPLSETTESYSIDILTTAGIVVRTLTSTSETVTYTSTNVAIDFPSGAPNPLLVNVYQLSSNVGRGFVGNGVVYWNGSIQKYNASEWRLLITSAVTGSTIAIAEVEFFDAVHGLDLAEGGVASSNISTAANAFDNSLATKWTGSVTSPASLEYKFITAKQVIAYTITAASTSAATQSPRDWVLQRKKVGWEDVHTVTGQTVWVDGEVKRFLF